MGDTEFTVTGSYTGSDPLHKKLSRISGKQKQGIHVKYDLVGFIPVDELIKTEKA